MTIIAPGLVAGLTPGGTAPKEATLETFQNIDALMIVYDTAAWFTSNNPILNAGQWGYESDTGIAGVGDGATAWATLDKFEGGGGAGDVAGPASAVDERVAVFDGVTGKLIKDGGKTIAELAASAISIVTDAADYSSTDFTVAQAGAEYGQHRIFTGDFANKINFPESIPAAAYGWVENRSQAAMTLRSPSGVTLNGVDNATINLLGLAYWVRSGTNAISVYGAIGATTRLDGIVTGHQAAKYNNLTGAQTLSRANFAAGSVLVHSGSAAAWTLPSRVTATDRTESLTVRNRGSDDITLSASGPTLVGNTIIEPTQSVVIEWEYDGTTERAWVDGATAAP